MCNGANKKIRTSGLRIYNAMYINLIILFLLHLFIITICNGAIMAHFCLKNDKNCAVGYEELSEFLQLLCRHKAAIHKG